ncbi:MAG: DUF3536 domain-containing protein [Elusimicrobiales bacterium]
MPAAPKKYVVIHGHFYQPPRENPWLGHVELEPSAHPYHDWNERIAFECYIPNGMARINDHQAAVVDVVNNYRYLSFNFGPTLLNWYAARFPDDYARILEADRESAARLGHGNALAQPYNHTILPLTGFRDRLTQIFWGIADFERRFGRRPEAMWLPETACSDDVLRLLIDQKMRYVILSPRQARRARPPGGEWKNVPDGSIDPRRPYLWQDRDGRGEPLPGRSIALFFYDGELSRAIAFERAMKDSSSAAARFDAAFDPNAAEDQLVHTATDGETYGHHHKFADLTLAHLFRHELARRGIEITNYGAYLDAHPPLWEAELNSGPCGEGSSWSCVHGVGRWKENCGCGAENGQHQKWRAPLRAALDMLSRELAAVFEKAGEEIFHSPWQARDEYIEVLADPSQRDRFLAKHCRLPPDPARTERALALLEMQKYAMYMFTSCGWFFSDISRIEAVQNLKYAARAMDIAAELGFPGLEGKFAAALACAPCNIAELGDGGQVFAKLALRSRVTAGAVFAEYGIRLLFSEMPERSRLYSFDFRHEKSVLRAFDGGCFAAGVVSAEERPLAAGYRAAFCALCLPDAPPRCYVGFEDPDGRFAALETSLDAPGKTCRSVISALEEIMGRGIGLENLLPEARMSVLRMIHKSRIKELSGARIKLFAEALPLLEQWRTLGLAVPEDMAAEAQSGARQFLAAWLERFSGGDLAGLDSLADFMPRVRACGIDANTMPVQQLFGGLIGGALSALEEAPSPDTARAALRFVRLAKASGASHWMFEAQNRVMRMFERWQAQNRVPPDRETDSALLELYAELNISVDGIISKLRGSRLA